jgi:hypothetical protein
MIRKLLRALELALIAVIGAVEWVIDWVERQSTAMKLGFGMLLGVAATTALPQSMHGCGNRDGENLRLTKISEWLRPGAIKLAA